MALDQFSYSHKDFWSHNDIDYSDSREDNTVNMMMSNPTNYVSENDVGQGFNLTMGTDLEYYYPCSANDGFSVQNESYVSAVGPAGGSDAAAAASVLGGGRSYRRRRARRVKNREEVETQRMTHIAVERNRRKQMNEYLAVLRSIMPSSYVQRGDQASIVGGAINFVKELEQLVQSLEAQKQADDINNQLSPNSLFADFFIFPQYSTCSSSNNNNNNSMSSMVPNQPQSTAEKQSPAADVEVTMVESHANIKVMMRGQKKQLLKIIVGLQFLGLVVLHLNVTTVDNMVLYSFSVKVEENCQMTSVNEIAASVYELVGRIQEEASSFSS